MSSARRQGRSRQRPMADVQEEPNESSQSDIDNPSSLAGLSSLRSTSTGPLSFLRDSGEEDQSIDLPSSPSYDSPQGGAGLLPGNRSSDRPPPPPFSTSTYASSPPSTRDVGGSARIGWSQRSPRTNTSAATSAQSSRNLMNALSALREKRDASPPQGTETRGYIDDRRSLYAASLGQGIDTGDGSGAGGVNAKNQRPNMSKLFSVRLTSFRNEKPPPPQKGLFGAASMPNIPGVSKRSGTGLGSKGGGRAFWVDERLQDAHVTRANPSSGGDGSSGWKTVFNVLWVFTVGLILSGMLVMVALMGIGLHRREKPTESPPPDENPFQPSQTISARYEFLRARFIEEEVSAELDLDTDNTPQQRALEWISDADPANLDVEEPFLVHRYGLAVLWFATGGDATPIPGPNEEVEKTDGMRSSSIEFDDSKDDGKPGWKERSNWMSGKGHCSWFGVSCPPKAFRVHYDGNDGVLGLNLTSNNMKGKLPREIGTAFGGSVMRGTLKSLDLSLNRLEGTIPEEVELLERLEGLYLGDNLIAGNLPEGVAKLTKLQNLAVGGNVLEGSIPSFVGNLTELRGLDMHDNYLNGALPDTIGSLTNMVELYLDSNVLSGKLPGEALGKISNMRDLRLGNNYFTGTIPTEIGLMTHLNLLYLAINELSGPIPHQLSQLKQLDELHLFRNMLTGTLPSELGILEDLIVMYVDQNNIDGQIPTEFGKMHDIQHLYFSKNKLTGPIPIEIHQMRDLTNFRAYDNQLTGQLPSEIGKMFKLEYLYLEDNKLTGSVPDEIGDLNKLVKFRIQNNDITGAVPQSVCALKDFNLKEVFSDCEGVPPEVECDCCVCEFD